MEMESREEGVFESREEGVFESQLAHGNPIYRAFHASDTQWWFTIDFHCTATPAFLGDLQSIY